MGLANKKNSESVSTPSASPGVREVTRSADTHPVKPPRDALGRVLPGHSLNPRGGPKGASTIAREIIERARGWEYLEDILKGRVDLPEGARVDVLFRLIDRGYGKAPNVNLTGELDSERASELIDLEPLSAAPLLQILEASRAGYALAGKTQQLPEDATFEHVLPPHAGGTDTEGKP